LKQFGLSAKERIKSKKEFDLVYSNGEFLFSSSHKFKAVLLIQRDCGVCGIKAAFAVSKKLGTAVWRNRVKRLLRESFRLNKLELCSAANLKNLNLIIVFSSNSINQKHDPKLSLKDVMPEIIELLNRIRAVL